MGTTLTGTTPQDTYDSLIKVTDNGPLSGTAKYLSDGLGNDSALAVSTTAVGIGTTSGTSKANILSSTVAQTVLTLEGNYSGSGSVELLEFNRSGGAVSGAIKYQDADTAMSIGTTTSHAFLFNTGDTEKMRITSAGNVGIGTSSPTRTLDVVGSSSTEFGALRLYNSAGSAGTQNSVSILLQNRNSINNLPSVKLIGQESSNDSNLGEFIVQQSNDNSAALVEVFRTAAAGAGGAPFLRMATGTGGIQFNGDTAAANALDDYEEGTFTPSVAFGGGSTGITYFDRVGNYTKVGRQVYVQMYVALTNKGTDTGNATITNLPFTVASANRGSVGTASLDFADITFTGQINAQAGRSATQITFSNTTEAGARTVMTNANFTNASQFWLNITYNV